MALQIKREHAGQLTRSTRFILNAYGPKTWFDCYRFRIERGLPANRYYAQWNPDQRKRVLEWMRGLFLWSDLHMVEHDVHAFKMRWTCDLPLSVEWAQKRGINGDVNRGGTEYDVDSWDHKSIDALMGAAVSLTRRYHWRDTIQLVSKHEMPSGSPIMTEYPAAYLDLGQYGLKMDQSRDPGTHALLQTATTMVDCPFIDRCHPRGSVFTPKYEWNARHLGGYEHPIWEMVDCWLRYTKDMVRMYQLTTETSQLLATETAKNLLRESKRIKREKKKRKKREKKHYQPELPESMVERWERQISELTREKRTQKMWEMSNLIKDISEEELTSVVATSFALRFIHEYSDSNCYDPMAETRFFQIPSSELRRSRGLDPEIFPDSLWTLMFGVIHMNGYMNQTLIHRELLGHGLYSITSFLDHSCDPNVCYAYIRGKMRCILSDRIQENTVLSTSYIAEMIDQSTPPERRVRLRTLGFNCHCHRCLDERASWKKFEFKTFDELTHNKDLIYADSNDAFKPKGKYKMSLWSEFKLLHHLLDQRAGDLLRNPMYKGMFRNDKELVIRYLMKKQTFDNMVKPVRDCFNSLDVLYGDAAFKDPISLAVLKQYPW